MRFPKPSKGRAVVTAALAAAVVVIAAAVAFEPVTRNVVAQQFVCFGCHEGSEYDPDAAGSPTTPHPATPEGGQARCVACHVPEGWTESFFVYTHFISDTDLFGRWHDHASPRHGAEVTPFGKRAYRVRDGLAEFDSVTCRTCHIESEMKPKRKRGQKAHARALKENETCIECHYNLVHREVDLRPISLD